LPDISKINNVAVADISKLDSITFAHGQKVNNQDVSLVTDAHTLIATATSDGSDASLGFTSGINSTYDVYEFHFTNMHPQTDNVQFQFQVNDSNDEGGGYDVSPITSTFISAYQKEDVVAANPGSFLIESDRSQTNQADYQELNIWVAGAVGDESLSGVLKLYAPSSTTYLKHFMSDTNTLTNGDYSRRSLVAGYINDRDAITQINFKFSSGEIQGGEIKMYGIAKA
jgi:hypothetical protein